LLDFRDTDVLDKILIALKNFKEIT